MGNELFKAIRGGRLSGQNFFAGKNSSDDKKKFLNIMTQLHKTRIERIEKYLPRHPLTSESPDVRLEGWNFHLGTTVIAPHLAGGSLECEAAFDDDRVLDYRKVHDKCEEHMKKGQWSTKEALIDIREATRSDLIFLQGCDEDWGKQPFGTVLIRAPTASGGCDDDAPADEGGSGGGAAADADADADAGTPRRDPASDAGESGGGAAAAGGGGGGGGESGGG